MKMKMVCSDLDGTLLQYGKKTIEGESFDQIRALAARGIVFCPARGRPAAVPGFADRLLNL